MSNPRPTRKGEASLFEMKSDGTCINMYVRGVHISAESNQMLINNMAFENNDNDESDKKNNG